MKWNFPAILGAAGLAAALLSGGCTKPSTAPTTTEVMVFEGGYGKDFYEKAAEEFKAKTGKDVKIIGDPRIDLQITPRMQKGDPPDLTYPGWRVKSWQAVEEGEVEDLTSALDGPGYGGQGKWRDAFDPAFLKLGQKDGKQMLMPYFFSVWGWWYDPELFAKNGWEPPKTYNDLLALCAKIKAAGIAPITYQGKYPDYMTSGMLLPWILSIGGTDAMLKCQNLEPGAWKDPAVVKAATMIKELQDMEYFQKGATALSHTEAQGEFVNGRAAMIPCGTWLYSEMEKEMPTGRKMRMFLPPVVGDGKGDTTALMVKIEPWWVPSKGKNKATAIEFFKYLTSPEKARQFVTEKGTFMAVKGSLPDTLPEHLQDAAGFYKSSKLLYSSQWREWYPDFYEIVGNIMTELLNGKVTPEQFADKVEAEAEKVRADKRQTKYTYKLD